MFGLSRQAASDFGTSELRSPWIAPVTLKQFAWLFLGWTAIGVFLATPGSLNGYWWPGLLAKVIEQWVWALMTPLLVLIVRRLAILDNLPLLRIGVLILMSVPFSLIVVLLDGVALLPFHAIKWNPFVNAFYYPYYFLAAWMTYCTVVGILEALRYHRQNSAEQNERQRLERRLLEVHLNALRMQLEPHFLFNGMNAISSVMISDPPLARDMLEHLSALLRLSLEFNSRNEIPLIEEIALLEHYLIIQQIRFGNRLKVDMLVDSDVKFALVPCFLLQPLVENAIRHGLSSKLTGGTVAITARAVGCDVEIMVQDDGTGLPAGWTLSGCTGVGLRITRERVLGHYTDKGAQFDVRKRKGGGTEVVMSLPLRLAGQNACKPTYA